jgi:hypothetical protein
MKPEEAEHFMALLLKAQSTSHKCEFCDYFKKATNKCKRTLLSLARLMKEARAASGVGNLLLARFKFNHPSRALFSSTF